jgi:hypothetical protein
MAFHVANADAWFVPARRILWLALLTSACSSGPVSIGDNRMGVGQLDAGGILDSGAGGSGAEGAAGGGTGGGAGAEPSLTASLLALADPSRCAPATDVLFPAHPGEPRDVAICQLSNAVFWKSGMDIMCDGQYSVECAADPNRSSQTAGTDSSGRPLDPTTLRYVEVPEADRRSGWDYGDIDLHLGSPAIVIYQDRYQFGVVGDEGADVLGEGSYRMAKDLGIPPDPVDGGRLEKVVTYIVFTGFRNRVRPIEDAALAEQIGRDLAEKLIAAGQ